MDTRAAPQGTDLNTPNVQDTFQGERPVNRRFN
jgi:hypothetical protein